MERYQRYVCKWNATGTQIAHKKINCSRFTIAAENNLSSMHRRVHTYSAIVKRQNILKAPWTMDVTQPQPAIFNTIAPII